MAATAYAALMSLLNTIAMEQTPRPSRFPAIPFPGELMDTLKAKVSFLVEFLEGGWKRADHLFPRMVDLAYKAEDTIESSVVDLILGAPTHTGSASLSGQPLEITVQDIESIVEEVNQIQGMSGSNDLPHSSGSRSLGSSSGETTKMVGFQDIKLQIMDVLTGNQSGGLRVIPIVGMGGAGKTTLARNIYIDERSVHHFDVRAWATISQEYNVVQVLRDVLSSLDGTQGNDEMDEGSLGQKVYWSLCGHRYLVILDDIWSIDAWDKVKRYFPNQNNGGSRIMVTTRNSNLARELSTESSFEVDCLDEEDSWSLLREKLFGQESCPLELEEVGKRIAKNCRGLPLTIVVTAGLLANSKTLEYWMDVALDFKLFSQSSNDKHCLKVLSLSYNHLPVHLKPCFLYWAIFPEDRLVRASEICKLWIAEGFLKPHASKTLEEIAKEYLIELTERHLIMVELHLVIDKPTIFDYTFNHFLLRERKYYVIHDELRKLCLREAPNENFLCIVTNHDLHAPVNLTCLRRIVVRMPKSELKVKEKPEIFHSLQSASHLRSLIVEDSGVDFSRVWQSPALKLLRVFYSTEKHPKLSVGDKLMLVNLRYFLLDSYVGSYFVSTISSFRNLQMLVVRAILWNNPIQIWNLPHLRHVRFGAYKKLEPSFNQQEQESVILENLQSFNGFEDFRFDEAILKRIPNVKKLRVGYGSECEKWSHYSANNIRLLEKLESLDMSFDVPPKHDELIQNLAFPDSLTKLSLKGCELVWDDMSVIGKLPNLQVLELKQNSFIGEEWNPIDGQFSCLKRLFMHWLDVKKWNAERSHFPVLKELILCSIWGLEKIPLDIGDIETLELIHLERCPGPVITSAKEIQEEQQGDGKEHLLVYVYGNKTSEFDHYKSKNFIVGNISRILDEAKSKLPYVKN